MIIKIELHEGIDTATIETLTGLAKVMADIAMLGVKGVQQRDLDRNEYGSNGENLRGVTYEGCVYTSYKKNQAGTYVWTGVMKHGNQT